MILFYFFLKKRNKHVLFEVPVGGPRLPGDGLALVVQEGSGLLLGQGGHDLQHPLHALRRINHPLVVHTRICKQNIQFKAHTEDANSPHSSSCSSHNNLSSTCFAATFTNNAAEAVQVRCCLNNQFQFLIGFIESFFFFSIVSMPLQMKGEKTA